MPFTRKYLPEANKLICCI